jgi:hypothetical protein
LDRPEDRYSSHEASSATLKALGHDREVFRPKLRNILAGIVLGLFMIAVGIVVPALILKVKDRQDMRPGDYVAKFAGFAGFAIVLPLSGAAMLVWMNRLRRHRVIVGEHGLACIYRGREHVFLWPEIREIREVFTHESIQVLHVLGASVKNLDRSFVVERKDGFDFRLTVNFVGDLPRLAERLEEASDLHEIPWKQLEIQ